MPGGGIAATTDVSRIEAPVTTKAYVMCAFAAFGGIFFGYDSGWINGVLGMNFVINQYTGLPIPPIGAPEDVRKAFTIPAPTKSLIVSILSCGTFFGAIFAGDFADWLGRRTTIIIGCGIFIVGAILQTASEGISLMVPGRLIAGIGVGFVSAIIILYMSEIAPKRVRGAIVVSVLVPLEIVAQLKKCQVWVSILYYHWSLASFVRLLRNPGSAGHRFISHPHCDSDALGHHSGCRPIRSTRIATLLRQEGQD